MYKVILDGLYKIYTNGDLYRISGNMLVKPHILKQGYLRVNTRNNGVQKKYLVHRLVAEAFLDNPYNKDTVDHIDGNKLNNNLTNLQWMTNGDNKRKSAAKAGKATDPNGRVHTFTCLNVFCRKHNLHASNFAQMLLGNPAYTHSEGWTK